MCEMEVQVESRECCHLCLSTERRLSSLEGLLDVYLLLVGSGAVTNWPVSSLRACWECHAMLRRVSRFMKQARWVRELLDTADDILLDSDICLSKLKLIPIFRLTIEAENPQKPTQQLNYTFGSFGSMTILPCDKDANDDQTQQCELRSTVYTNEELDPSCFDIKEEEEEDMESNCEHAGFKRKLLRDESQQSDNQAHLNTNAVFNKKKAVFACGNITDKSQQQPNILQKIRLPVGVTLPSSLTVSEVVVSQQIPNVTTGSVLQQDDSQANLSTNTVCTQKRTVFACDNITNISQQEPNISQKIQLPVGVTLPSSLTVSEVVVSQQIPNVTTGSVLQQDDSQANLSTNTVCTQKRTVFACDNITNISQQEPNISQKIQLPVGVTLPSSLTVSEVSQQIPNVTAASVLQQDDSQANLSTNTVCTQKRTVFACDNITNISQQEPNISQKIQLPLGVTLPSSLVVSEPIDCPESLDDCDEVIQEVVVPAIETKVKVTQLPLKKQDYFHLQQRELEKNTYMRSTKVETNKKQFFMTSIKVTESQLKDFIKRSRNDEKYLSSPYECRHCILGFNNISLLNQHKDRCKHLNSAGVFVCNICDRRMTSEWELKNHLKIHKCLYVCSERDFIGICPLIVREHYLEKHTENAHGIGSHKIIEHTANKTHDELEKLYRLMGLKDHATHDEVDNHSVCPPLHKVGPVLKTIESGKKLESPKYSNLKIFKPSQQDIENLKKLCMNAKWSCVPCCLIFSRKNFLFEHSKFHSKEAGAYMCDVCTLRFTSEWEMNAHRDMHDSWYRCVANRECKYVSPMWEFTRGHLHCFHPRMRKKSSKKSEHKNTNATSAKKCLLQKEV